MIKSSLDWDSLEISLKRQAKGLTNGKEVVKMIDNIRPSITQLSKAEVEIRQGRKIHLEELLFKIRQDIEIVEGYILIAALLG
jgi:hypothetical protein